MRVLVTGSRKWRWPEVISEALEAVAAEHGEVVVVHGACPTGADAWADVIAAKLGMRTDRFPAKWKRPGGVVDKAAGFKRNQVMVDTRPDLCLAFIVEGQSKGTLDCATRAQLAGIEVRRFFRSES